MVFFDISNYYAIHALLGQLDIFVKNGKRYRKARVFSFCLLTGYFVINEGVEMTTGTIIMIVCAVLYGLIVILFKFKKGDEVSKPDIGDRDDPFVGVDGTPGACGVCSDDLGVFKKSR